MKFSGNGVFLATGSFDKKIYVWEVYGECPHTMTLNGHKNAVQEVHWSTDSETIFSASADSTVMVWDTQTGERIKKVVGHESFVNSCCPARRGPPLFVSGSDDGTARLWDLRAARRPQAVFKHKFQVTAVCLSDAADQLFAGSIDNTVRCWDLRAGGASEGGQPEPVYSLAGHTDTVTSLSLSPNGKQLLTNGMDNTARIWDVSAFVVGGERLVRTMQGHNHGFEKLLLKSSWSPDGTLVGVGSSVRQACWSLLLWAELLDCALTRGGARCRTAWSASSIRRPAPSSTGYRGTAAGARASAALVLSSALTDKETRCAQCERGGLPPRGADPGIVQLGQVGLPRRDRQEVGHVRRRTRRPEGRQAELRSVSLTNALRPH